MVCPINKSGWRYDLIYCIQRKPTIGKLTKTETRMEQENNKIRTKMNFEDIQVKNETGFEGNQMETENDMENQEIDIENDHDGTQCFSTISDRVLLHMIMAELVAIGKDLAILGLISLCKSSRILGFPRFG
jgi:hypothetical protein